MRLIDRLQFWKINTSSAELENLLFEKRRITFSKNPELALEVYPELKEVHAIYVVAQNKFNEIIQASSEAVLERNYLRAKAVGEEALRYFDANQEIPIFNVNEEWKNKIETDELLFRRIDLSEKKEKILELDDEFRRRCQGEYLKLSEAYFKNENAAINEYPELNSLITLKKQSNQYYGEYLKPENVEFSVKDCLHRAIKDIASGVPVQSKDEIRLHAEYLNHSIIGIGREIKNTHEGARNNNKNNYRYPSSDLIHLLIGRNGLQTGFWLPLTEKQYYDEPKRILNINEEIGISQRKASFLVAAQEETLKKYPDMAPIYYKHNVALNLYQQKTNKDEALYAAFLLVSDDFNKIIKNEPLQAVNEYGNDFHNESIKKSSLYVEQRAKIQSQTAQNVQSLTDSIQALSEIHMTANKVENSSQITSNDKESKNEKRSSFSEFISTAKPLNIGHLFQKNQLHTQDKQIDANKISNELNENIEPFLKQLLGEPNSALSNSSEFRYGNKGSLSVKINGEYQGRWTDFENGKNGNLLQLIEKERKCTFIEALNYGAGFLGYQDASMKIPDNSKDQKSTERYAKYLYTQAKSVNGTIAETYLKQHRGILNIPQESCYFLQSVRDNASGKTLPAIAFFSKGQNNEVQGAQVIYLDPETAQKADISIPKRSFGTIKGTFVPIQYGQGRTIAVAEGPETALSIASADKDLTVFASLGGLTNFSKIEFEPMGVKIEGQPLILCADNDKNNKSTLEKINKAASELTKNNFNVFICKPEKSGHDFNDVIKSDGIEKIKEYLKGAELYKHGAKITQDIKKNCFEMTMHVNKSTNRFHKISNEEHELER